MNVSSGPVKWKTGVPSSANRVSVSGEVAAALAEHDRELAGKLLLDHLRTRTTPLGPGFHVEYHGTNYREVADAVLENRYGTLGPFAKFEKTYIDGKGNRQPAPHHNDNGSGRSSRGRRRTRPAFTNRTKGVFGLRKK